VPASEEKRKAGAAHIGRRDRSSFIWVNQSYKICQKWLGRTKKKFDVKKILIKFHQHFLAAFSQTGNMLGQYVLIIL
jgi:hypothetical protein